MNVDRDARIGPAAVMPRGGVSERGFQYPGIYLGHEPRLLRDREEFARSRQSSIGLPPAEQRFDRADLAAGKMDLGLIGQLEFLAFERQPQSLLNRKTGLRTGDEFRRKYRQLIAAQLFGAE